MTQRPPSNPKLEDLVSQDYTAATVALVRPDGSITFRLEGPPSLYVFASDMLHQHAIRSALAVSVAEQAKGNGKPLILSPHSFPGPRG